MARPIKFSNEMSDVILKEIREYLTSYKMDRGTLQLTKTYNLKDVGVQVVIQPEVFVRMMKLVHHFTTEVGWHMEVRRDNADDSLFYVENIHIYPQIVTGIRVDTDQRDYENWLMSLDDEVFHSLRGHGHSHVNMSVQPSAKDDEHRQSILEKCDGEDFYLFMILNKSQEVHVLLYDLKTNILYEHQDIELTVGNISFSDLAEFSSAAEKLVKTPEVKVSAKKNKKNQNQASQRDKDYEDWGQVEDGYGYQRIPYTCRYDY